MTTTATTAIIKTTISTTTTTTTTPPPPPPPPNYRNRHNDNNLLRDLHSDRNCHTYPFFAVSPFDIDLQRPTTHTYTHKVWPFLFNPTVHPWSLLASKVYIYACLSWRLRFHLLLLNVNGSVCVLGVFDHFLSLFLYEDERSACVFYAPSFDISPSFLSVTMNFDRLHTITII